MEEMMVDGYYFVRVVSFGLYVTDEYHLKVRLDVSE